jgi:hypothetical protein
MAFSRASNLIRKAVGLKGAIFFDANIGSFDRGSKNSQFNKKAPAAFHINGESETASSSKDGRKQLAQGTGKHPLNTAAFTTAQPSSVPSDPSKKPCNILGYLTRTRSSLYEHECRDDLRSFPEDFLRKLLKRYPHGKVFNFEEDGSVSSSDSEANTQPRGDAAMMSNAARKHPLIDAKSRQKRKMSKEAEATSFLAVVPGARSVAFFPL